MSTTWQLYLRWKAHTGMASDRKAMKDLGLSPTAYTHWKAGREASLAVIERMATDLGEDHVPLALQAFHDSAANHWERGAWTRLARRMGYAAAVILAVSAVRYPEAGHALFAGAGLYIMRN